MVQKKQAACERDIREGTCEVRRGAVTVEDDPSYVYMRRRRITCRISICSGGEQFIVYL